MIIWIKKENFDSFVFTDELKSADTLSIQFEGITFQNSFEIPKNTIALGFTRCKFIKLPTIPKNIKALSFCNMYDLKKLPKDFLPDGLENLFFINTGLTSLPKKLGRLKLLYCIENKFTSLPILPTQLLEFNCFNNYFSKLYFDFGDFHLLGKERIFDEQCLLVKRINTIRSVNELIKKF